MNRISPPRFAIWILEHLIPGGRNEALTGDLFEDFNAGRSRGWYWRQVLSAIAIGFLREVRVRFHVIVFATVWCLLAPAWLMVASGAAEQAASSWHIWQFEWPWSAICSLALAVAPGLVFVWAGMAVYLLPELHQLRGRGTLHLGMKFVSTMLVFTAVSAGVTGSVMLIQNGGRRAEWHGPSLSIEPPAPYFVPKAVGGGRDVRVIRSGHNPPVVQVTTRVYVDSHPFWVPKSFQLDGISSVVRPGTSLAAIEEAGLGSILNRLTVFSCLLFALWRRYPKPREGR